VSEKLNSPARVIALMNDFLTPMSDVIMGLRGTIDKYIGDAIMAFWNAPLDNAAHAVDSCRAALQMKHALAPVNAAIAQNAKQQGIEHFTLRAGIGLNSGLCAVGNMGSRRRFSYSALGDAVNLAARLEKQTRFYGVDIIIGEATLASARAQGAEFAVLELDHIQVQGKANITTIYALLGDESFAQSPDFLALKAPHDALIAHYQHGDFIKAKESLEACKPLALDEMLEVYLIYEQRLDALLREPPEGAWSGIYVPESK
jgi:adenylate cyclase